MIEYNREKRNFSEPELYRLYSAVGWTAYTQDLPLLQKAIRNSLKVISAYANGELIGLARAVGDGLTIIYLQDLLVLPEYQGKGIGSAFIQEIFETEYAAVRQKVLLTEESPNTRAFYEKQGFHSCDSGPGHAVAFAKFSRPTS